MDRWKYGVLQIIGSCLILGLLLGATAVAPHTAAADPVSTAGSADPDANPQEGPDFVAQVLMLVNEERWTNGQLPPLKGVDLLHNSSQLHSDNMANRDFFAHCDLDTGDSPWDRMIAAGYNYNAAAENIAAGYGTPAAVITGWMNSPGHRGNILSPDFREIGVGYTYQDNDQGNVRGDANGDCVADEFNKGPYYRYWTQNFGRRNSTYPVVINREAYETTHSEVNLYVYGEGWAGEMRFRNEDGAWSNWEPYSTGKTWTLSGGNGVKTVHAEIRNGSGTVRDASDTILLNAATVPPQIGVTPDEITVVRMAGDNATEPVSLRISNGGTEVLHWSAGAQPAVGWLTVMPDSGSTAGGGESSVTVTIDPAGMSPGQHATQIEVSGNAGNSPQTVDVTLKVYEQLYTVYLPLSVRE